MPAVKDSDLFKQLKTGVPSGGYYLYGPETTFSLAALRRLEQRTDTGSFDAFNRIRFDGAKLDMAELDVYKRQVYTDGSACAVCPVRQRYSQTVWADRACC